MVKHKKFLGLSLSILLLILLASPKLTALATSAHITDGGENPEVSPLPDEIAGVPGASEGWWSAVQEQILLDTYTINRIEGDSDTSPYRAHNPSHGFEVTFTPQGVAVSSAARGGQGSEGDPSWTLNLRFSGLGPPGQLQPIPAEAEMVTKANRVSYRRSDIVEWYINDERGLKQGFTLEERPAAIGNGQDGDNLVLEISLDTGLVPTISEDAQSIDFRLAGGTVPLLRYSELVVNDASGRRLPAHLALGGSDLGGGSIRIVIDAARAIYPITVDPLIAEPDWTAAGEAPGDLFGFAVGTAGDVNGDGYADVIVGAPVANSSSGKAYLYPGSASGLSASPAWTATGEAADDEFGTAVGTAGDVNGDGYADVIVGAPNGDLDQANFDHGKSYLYLGSPSGLASSPVWTASGEFVGDRFGDAVSTAGDVNGDGYADVVIGARLKGSTPAQVGKAYLYLGSASSLASNPAWTASGEAEFDQLGYAVGTAGDVNGDGFADVIIGAPSPFSASAPGKAYLYLGSLSGLGASPAWTASGEAIGDSFGYDVGTAGDVDGDGFTDVIVGAPSNDSNGFGAGKTYLYLGSNLGLSPGSDWTASGEAAGDNFGWGAGTAGDVNGDGFADVIVGAPFNNSNGTDAGKAYLYLGSASGLSTSSNWTASGEAAFITFGRAAATAGDVNGDGYADVIVGAPFPNSSAGKAYLYPGPSLGITIPYDWASTGADANDEFGRAVAAAGDVNGDGYSDVLVGAPANDENGILSGKVYLFYGSEAGLELSPGWSTTGEAVYDQLGAAVAPAGDVNGDGYDEVLIAAPGYDSDRGKIYLFYGSASGVGESPGWTASGQYSYDQFGRSVSTAGDVDGDGYADVIAGAVGYPAGSGYGKTYLYRGSAVGLSSSASWSATGEAAGDFFGSSAATAGDVNGDTYADVIVGAPGSDPSGLGGAGRAYLYQGSPSGLNASPAWTASGEGAGDQFGYAVGTAGDVNGDGYADVITGAPNNDTNGVDSGRVYLYSGSASGLGTSPVWTTWGEAAGDKFGSGVGTGGDTNGNGYADVVVGAFGVNSLSGKAYLYLGPLSGLGTSPAWTASGEGAGDQFGYAVGTAGDVNGDGYSDVLAGAWGYNAPGAANAGRAYVFQGSASSLSSSSEWTASGEAGGDVFGEAVAAAGDVNGDGYTDIVIGSPWNDSNGTDAGKAYLYLGSASGLGVSPAWTASGEAQENRFGDAVSTAGDVNGDGFADVIIGASRNDSTGTDAGKAYLYLGSVSGLSASPAWTASGEAADDWFGFSVGTAGDVNGDGYADVIVGAPLNDSDGISAGKAYLYLGSASGLSASSEWTGNGGQGAERFGWAADTAGDVNGDGYADAIVGAPGVNGSAGKAYLYLGSASGLSPSPGWPASGEAQDDNFGYSVGTAGDVNGDGFADLIVGAPVNDSNGTNAGKAYLYLGSALGADAAPFWTASGEAQNDSFGYMLGTAGDVNGDSYADVMVGSPFNDSNGTSAGKAYLYLGSALGADATPVWTASGEAQGDQFGAAVGTAGDVNGDGYGDVMSGAWLNDANGSGAGKAYLYQGNDGGGRGALVRQARADGSHPVQPWSASHTPEGFQVSLEAVNPLGRGKARLQVQVCPAGTPFGGAACLEQTSDEWTDVWTGGGDRVTLRETIGALDTGTLYRWRARLLYDSPFYSRGPWRRFQSQAMEADIRVALPAADLFISKTMTPEDPLGVGEPITYTLAFASNGPATGVTITDTIPSGISDLAVISSGVAITDTGASPSFVWEVQDLGPGDSGQITITGIAQQERFFNEAVISAASPDPNLRNNTASVQTHIEGVIYVDQNAGGADNGTSWSDAYPNLGDALEVAAAGDQIWVAEGVYTPGEVITPTRTASFHLKSGVALHGGFSGSETTLKERDWVAHPTILSGDIGTPNNAADNVFHVVTAPAAVTQSAVLDAFIITGGNADGSGPDGRGGGLYNDGGGPTLLNLTFAGNAALEGGGMYSSGGGPTLVNVAFTGNSASSSGGGIYNESSTPHLTNVTIVGNEAGNGGGVVNAGSTLAITNSVLWNNTAVLAGDQISNTNSTALISYSDIQGSNGSGGSWNLALGDDGGGNIDANPQFYDADGLDNQSGTLDDDLRLRHSSPVKDAGDNQAVSLDDFDLDSDGVTGEPLLYDLSNRRRLVGFTVITPTVDMGAYEATILDVLADADALLELGTDFREEHLQLLSSDTLAEALQNYANFNDGEWYFTFCKDYDQIDENGYCPWTISGGEKKPEDNVRNALLDTAALYRVALGYPTEVYTTVRAIEVPVWDRGGNGVTSATVEIANDHLIFGNEFLVDATDYRFSTAGIPNADQIIAEELDELEQAQRHFELILDLIFRVFNEWEVGSYLTTDQFEQFGVASSRMTTALGEQAARYYMLRQEGKALGIYEQAYSDQYHHLVALAEVVEGTGSAYLRNGSWEMLNNLSQMRHRAQAIHDGLDFFGFAPDYVPLQPYEQLLQLVEGLAGSTGLLGTARDLEDQARDAQRTFDKNASDMATELDNLSVELDNQLFDLCGETEDSDGDGFGDYEACEGGLMAQNFESMDAASLRLGLAWLQAQNIAEQIRIEEERVGREIQVTLGLADTISAYQLAVGKLEAERTTRTTVQSSEDSISLGVAAKFEAFIGKEFTISSNPTENKAEVKSGFKFSAEATAGYNHAWTWSDSTQTVFDPTAEAIAQYDSLQALKEAEAQAEIANANSEAVIRNLLLQQTEALQEYEIAVAEFNKLSAEHDYLAERRSRLLNKRAQAINRVASHNSHLLSPAYRIWRDSLTTQAASAHALAAQFAYLTARAAEYELLTPYPDLDQIFRARTSNDIRLFLDDLKVWVQALDLPGQLNRYPYTISLAQDIWGLTDEALDPGGVLSEEELSQLRHERFQDILEANLNGGTLELRFSTSLDQQRPGGIYLFSPNIWNNRIAGVGAPLPENEGVSVNIVTNQTSQAGDPEVVLIHGGPGGGAEAYRNAAGQIVYYDPDTAVPVGYKLPDELDPANTSIVLRPGVNGAGAVPNSGLINLSVAATSWTLRVPRDSKGNLDYSQIEDIEIVMDSTGRALPDQQPVGSTPPIPEPQALPPSIPGEISGPYDASIVITSPLTVAVQVLNVDLWNTDDVLTGTVNAEETSFFPEDIELDGEVDGDTFLLTTEVFTNVVSGREVTQTFTLTGTVVEDGNILQAFYTLTINNLLPEPIVVGGQLSGSRPSAPGSERLLVDVGARSILVGTSTPITATLFDQSMNLITETREVTFSTQLGAVLPASTATQDGTAYSSFEAGLTPGETTIFATTGEITGTVRLQVGTALADLSVSKSIDLQYALPGSTLHYTVVVTNTGPSPTSGVVLTDTFDGDRVEATESLCTSSGDGLVCDLGSLAAGQTVTQSYSLTLRQDAPLEPFNNTVTVASETPDPQPTNNTAATSTEVIALADLSVGKSVDLQSALPGSTLQYTVVVTNAGPSPASGVVLTDTFDSDRLESLESTCTPSDGGLVCDLGSLAAGQTVTQTYSLTLRQDTPLELFGNTVAVASETPDPLPTNNTAAASTEVIALADLSVSKSVDLPSALPGSTLHYTVVVTNTGPSPASGVVLTDTFNADRVESLESTCTPSDGGLVCDLGSLAAAQTVTRTYTLTLRLDTPLEPFNNTVKVASETPDPQPENNTAATSTEVSALADLLVGKLVDLQSALPGSTLHYTVVVTNAGPSPASGVVLTDTFNADRVESLESTCTPSDGGLVCDLGSLAPGQTVTQTYSLTLRLDTPLEPFNNTVTVASETLDAQPENNSAAASTEVVDPITAYENDFEDTAGDEWCLVKLSQTPSGRGFLGEFFNETVCLELDSLPPHTRITLEFDLYIIRSWDGNVEGEPGAVLGPDIWVLRLADGQTLLETTFSNWDQLDFTQAYPGWYPDGDYPARTGAVESNTLGYTHSTVPMDAVYHLTFTFDHSDPTLALEFIAESLQAGGDESWGLDNLQATLHPSPLVQIYLPVIAR